MPGEERCPTAGATVLPVPVGEDGAFAGNTVDAGRSVAHHAHVAGANVELTDIVTPDHQNVRFSAGLCINGQAGERPPPYPGKSADVKHKQAHKGHADDKVAFDQESGYWTKVPSRTTGTQVTGPRSRGYPGNPRTSASPRTMSNARLPATG